MPFKEEIKKRGWETVNQHREPSRRSLVKLFYANLGEREALTCYIKGRWVPFGERFISQLLGLRVVGDCAEYEWLQRNSDFEEIARELTGGLGE